MIGIMLFLVAAGFLLSLFNPTDSDWAEFAVLSVVLTSCAAFLEITGRI